MCSVRTNVHYRENCTIVYVRTNTQYVLSYHTKRYVLGTMYHESTGIIQEAFFVCTNENHVRIKGIFFPLMSNWCHFTYESGREHEHANDTLGKVAWQPTTLN